MIYYVMLLAGLEGVLPVAPAAVGNSKAPPARVEGKTKVPSRPTNNVKRETSASASADFEITATSEVKLNGRACRFKDVPNNAVIARIEVDADTKAILIIHFRTEQ